MHRIHRLAAWVPMIALLGLSGCVIAPDHDRGYRDHDEYRYENGDRIDREGHREVHWCDSHHDDEHCR